MTGVAMAREAPVAAVAAPGDPAFVEAMKAGPVWLPEVGMGFYPVDPADEPYDRSYWDKYVGYANTERGEALTRFRADLVRTYTSGELVDIGIGCGQFVLARGAATYGFDVNPVAVKWLQDRGLWLDPYTQPVHAVTCWDVLEHLPDPAALLRQVTHWAFVTVPLVGDSLRPDWKHFRTDEHRWYWTRHGLIWWMREQGFRCRAESSREEELGREDVRTFAFERTQ